MKFKNIEKDRFLSTLEEKISQTSIPDFVKLLIDKESSKLFVKVDKKGQSEVEFNISEEADSLEIEEINRKVSLLHRPFIKQADSMLDDLLSQVAEEIHNA
jgi:hypothetical protein